MLYLVATPIGNLSDITLRALQTLKEVDYILCEDTRVTRKLISHFDIKKPLKTLTDFNEKRTLPTVLEDLENKQAIALVSDAGSPLISDPGFKLVREATKRKLPIDIIPGTCAVITGLQISALPPDKFSFVGYLPKKQTQRLKLMQQLEEISKILPQTFIFFESPYRLIKTLNDLATVLGKNQQIVICRELTKLHQEIRKESVRLSIQRFEKIPPKGELTLLLSFSA